MPSEHHNRDTAINYMTSLGMYEKRWNAVQLKWNWGISYNSANDFIHQTSLYLTKLILWVLLHPPTWCQKNHSSQILTSFFLELVWMRWNMSIIYITTWQHTNGNIRFVTRKKPFTMKTISNPDQFNVREVLWYLSRCNCMSLKPLTLTVQAFAQAVGTIREISI